MTTRLTNRRRQLMVHPAVQSSIIVNISWPPAVALAIAALLLGMFSTRLLDEAMVAQVELPSLVPMLATVIGFLVVALGFLVFHALKLSNRIAGPIHRLNKAIGAARAGDYSTRVHLRADDYLGELADSLNGFLAELEQHPAAAATEAQATDGAGPQGRGDQPEPAPIPPTRAAPPAP